MGPPLQKINYLYDRSSVCGGVHDNEAGDADYPRKAS